jgi:hypothetical protein
MDEPSPAERPTRRRPIAWRRWLPRAVFESVLIVFSVILALAVTDWANQRRTAVEVAEVRGFFIEEIRANRAILVSDPILPHHRRLLEVFNETADSETLTVAGAMAAYGAVFETGIHIPPLRDAVWRSAGTGDLLGEMPIEDVFVLADVYAAQAHLMETSTGFVSNMPPLLAGLEKGEGVRAAVLTGQLHLGDVVATEEGLVALYDRALIALGAEAPVPAATRADDEAAPTG